MLDKCAYQEIFEVVKSDIKKIENRFLEILPKSCEIYSDLEKFLKSPSKRIRSVLALLYLRAMGVAVGENQLELLAIVELIHNASLIHDDVIDEEKIRRSQKNINSKFGNKMAIISGDYLLSVVMEKLTRLGKLELFEIFSKTIKEMCEGEILQYSNLYKIPTLEDYLKKTYQKTGSLFEACVLGCVMLSTSQEVENAKEFSKNFGIAFQIRDDIENILKGGNDIKEGIYNAPIIFSGSIDNPAAGIEKSKVLLNNYLDIAQKCLCGMDESEYKSALKKLLELLKYD